tara:strand:+ start:3320 stop:4060 length:741 start_codon:yes stop_codon:yes gene_type:complete
MKIHQYSQMIKSLTKNNNTPEQNRLADLKRNLPNQKRMLKKRNELGIDTSSLQDSINKAELELEQFKAPVKKDVFDRIGERIIDGMVVGEDLDPKEQIVKYDSATGLFSNNKKDIGFKDVASARKHNEVYEKYVPEIQSLQKAVTPRVKPRVKPSVKPIVKQTVKPTVFSPIPQFDMNYQPYKRDPRDEIAEAKFKKILDDARKQKELESTQGLPSLIPGASKIIERSESRMTKNKPITNGGDDDL